MRFAVIFLLILISSACSSERQLSSGFEKRIYRRGVHVDIKFKQGDNTATMSQLNNARLVSMNNASPDIIKSTRNTFHHSIGKSIVKQRSNFSFAQPTLIEKGQFTRSTLPSNITWESHQISERTNIQNDTILKQEEPEPNSPTVSRGVVSIIALGIALLNLALFMWIPVLGVLFGIMAVVIALKATEIDSKTSRILGIASIIISALTLFVSVLMTIALFSALQIFPI